jgi:hypothetical protein
MRVANERVVGLLGVAGVVLPVAALAVLPIWDFPGTGRSGMAVQHWADQHQGRLQVVMVLNTLGVTLWLAFGAALRPRLRGQLPAESPLADLFGSGFTAMTTILLAGFTSFDVLVYRAHDLGAGEARLLYDLAFGLLAMSGMPAAVALGAFAIATRRYDVAPSFLGVLAAVTAVAHLVLPSSLIVPSGPLSLESWPITVVPALLFAWILAAGIEVFRTRSG